MRDVSRRMARDLLFLAVAVSTNGCLTEFPSRVERAPDEGTAVVDAESTALDARPPLDDRHRPDIALADGAVLDAASPDAAPASRPALRIEPAFIAVRFDETVDVRALEVRADGTERDRTPDAEWFLADREVAAVSDDPATPGRLYPLAVGETTLVATVRGRNSAPANVRISPLPGTPPSARLRCPAAGEPAETLVFDASESSDADGPLAAYLFDFGDAGEPLVDGTEPVVEHTFTRPGRYDVRLTVVDGSAASDVATCQVDVGGAALVPRVRLLEPAEGLTVAPGEVVTTVVEAQAADGRTIVSVSAILAGAWGGEVAQSPYRLEVVVPAEVAAGETLVLVAQAQDESGVVGTSAPVHLVVGAE